MEAKKPEMKISKNLDKRISAAWPTALFYSCCRICNKSRVRGCCYRNAVASAALVRPEPRPRLLHASMPFISLCSRCYPPYLKCVLHANRLKVWYEYWHTSSINPNQRPKCSNIVSFTWDRGNFNRLRSKKKHYMFYNGPIYFIMGFHPPFGYQCFKAISLQHNPLSSTISNPLSWLC